MSQLGQKDAILLVFFIKVIDKCYINNCFMITYQ